MRCMIKRIWLGSGLDFGRYSIIEWNVFFAGIKFSFGTEDESLSSIKSWAEALGLDGLTCEIDRCRLSWLWPDWWPSSLPSVPWPALSSLSRNAPLLPHPPLLSLSPATKNGLTVNNTREILLYKCNKLLYEVLKSTLGLMVFWEMLIQTITCFSFYFATTKQTHTRIVVMDTREQLLSWGQTPQITPHIKRSFPLNCIVT